MILDYLGGPDVTTTVFMREAEIRVGSGRCDNRRKRLK